MLISNKYSAFIVINCVCFFSKLTVFFLCAFFSQVLPSQCRHRGAMLVFTVMDHDLVFQNDFGGEAFLPLADVPGVNGEEVSGFDALHVISLALIHPKVVGTCLFVAQLVTVFWWIKTAAVRLILDTLAAPNDSQRSQFSLVQFS